MAYLNVSFSVRWIWLQTSSMVELLRTIKASEKSGPIPFLSRHQREHSDTGLMEVLPLGVYAQQSKLLPATIHDILDAQIELAAHDGRAGLSRQLV